MNALLAIVRREYLSRVKSKWFLISTIGAPILMVGVGALSVYAGSQGSQNDRIVIAASSDGDLVTGVLTRMLGLKNPAGMEQARPDSPLRGARPECS